MPEKITLDDEHEYTEYSITELEKIRVELETNRRLKSGRHSTTKGHAFIDVANVVSGRMKKAHI